MTFLSIALPSSEDTVDQAGVTREEVTSKELCANIFDDLLDRNLLGFLLSSAHMRKYLAHYASYAEPKFSAAITRDLASMAVVDKLHKSILQTFSGFFIAEATIGSRRELMRALDTKYEAFAETVGTTAVRYEASVEQLESAELAWRYRNACATGRLTPPKA